MSKKNNNPFGNLPVCAAEFIKLVVKKMRYRKKVRADVQAELIAHFEDGLKECKTDKEKEKTAQKLIEDFGDVKLLAVLLRRAKKRCRPFWRTIVARSFQTAGVLILCLMLYIGWFFSGKPVITTNYLVKLNRFVRSTADDSLNAAPIYEKAVELFKKSYNANEPNNITKYVYKTPDEITPEEKQLIQQWLNENMQIFDLVKAGTKKPYYWNQYSAGSESTDLIAILLPDNVTRRRLAEIFCWRGRLLAEKGQFNKAFEDIKTCYRFGRHLRGRKTFIEQLTGMAIQSISMRTLRDILKNYQVEPDSLADIQKDFEKIIVEDDLAINIELEKLALCDELQRCFTCDRIGGGHLYLNRAGRLGGLGSDDWWTFRNILRILFTHPDKQQTKETYDKLYDFWEEMIHKTPAQLRNENIDFNEKVREIVKGNLLLELFAPAVGRVIELGHRTKTDAHATLAIIAILSYNQDTGNYPQSLNELAEAGYLKQMPIDLYSDKPLVYKRFEGGFTLYSIGADFDDDSGVHNHWGQGKEGGDNVFWPTEK